MREAEFAQRIENTADLLGLRWHHETDSRKSKKGFPDYCFVGPDGVMFLEIKGDGGKATPEQKEWIADLAAANEGRGYFTEEMAPVVTAYFAWPNDWDRVLSDLKRIAGRS